MTQQRYMHVGSQKEQLDAGLNRAPPISRAEHFRNTLIANFRSGAGGAAHLQDTNRHLHFGLTFKNRDWEAKYVAEIDIRANRLMFIMWLPSQLMFYLFICFFVDNMHLASSQEEFKDAFTLKCMCFGVMGLMSVAHILWLVVGTTMLYETGILLIASVLPMQDIVRHRALSMFGHPHSAFYNLQHDGKLGDSVLIVALITFIMGTFFSHCRASRNWVVPVLDICVYSGLTLPWAYQSKEMAPEGLATSCISISGLIMVSAMGWLMHYMMEWESRTIWLHNHLSQGKRQEKLQQTNQLAERQKQLEHALHCRQRLVERITRVRS